MYLVERALQRLNRFPSSIAFLGNDFQHTFGDVVQAYRAISETNTITEGTVVALRAGRYDAELAGAFLALVEKKCLVVPVFSGLPAADTLSSVGIEGTVELGREGHVSFVSSAQKCASPAAEKLRRLGHSGIVVFSSGTTGRPKAVLHDLDALFSSFLERDAIREKRIAAFNGLNRIAGVYLLLSSLAAGSTLVELEDSQPHTVADAIARHRIQVLPTSPSFLNLLILSGALEKFDLSSLELINYGSEPINDFTLSELKRLMPNVALRQLFGTSELGLVKTISESGSPFFRSGDPRVELRVRDGRFEIKSPHVMVGHLNGEPEPEISPDGWMATGDLAEQTSEGIRVWGRAAESINVGGNQVSPVLVEGVISAMPNVRDVSVCGEDNEILGQIVKARVALKKPQELSAFREELWDHCKGKLTRFQTPQKIELVADGEFVGEFKKKRLSSS